MIVWIASEIDYDATEILAVCTTRERAQEVCQEQADGTARLRATPRGPLEWRPAAHDPDSGILRAGPCDAWEVAPHELDDRSTVTGPSRTVTPTPPDPHPHTPEP